MPYRFGAVSVRRKQQRRRTVLVYLMTALVLCGVGAVGLMTDLFQSAAASPMQLVRLNVNQDGGLVRIEITADGSFNDATIEQLSRGRETIIRIRGARSLLRPTYGIDDQLARGIRIVSGERDGEPYVDVMIALGDGATLAQRKSFNRLIIGVAADFAHLRRRGPTDAESARRTAAPRPATSSPNGTASSQAVAATRSTQSTPSSASTTASAVNTFASAASSQEAATASLLASLPEPSLRSRPLWARILGAPPRPSGQREFNWSHGAVPSLYSATVAAGQPSLFNFVPMTIEAPGTELGVWVPGTTTSMEDEIGGRVLGKGVLRPSFLFGAQFSDNFFYRSQTGANLGVFILAPRLEYEVPGEERALRIAYESRLRKLSNGKWANGHLLDFDMRADLTGRLRLGVREHFIRSPLDLREYDPAGETYIVGDTFNRNDFSARLDYELGQRSRLGFELGSDLVRWSESHIAAAPLFIDYDEVQAALHFERDISETTTGTLSFTFNDTDTFAPLRPQFDGLSDNRRYALEIGARTQVTDDSGLAFRIGFERSDYHRAPSANDFRGLIFDLLYRRQLTEKTDFQLAALRKTQVSIFNNEGGNARLLTTGGSARLENAPTDALKLAVGLYYQQLGFPVAIVSDSTASGGVFVGGFAGERRTDHLYGFSLEGVYRWSDLLRSRLVYSFSRRDSTIPVLTFNTHRVSLIFELGRRNDVRGRPF